MRYEKRIIIGKQEAVQINKHLHEEPTCADECLGEDITIVNTATFDNGIEMDIKCCGVQYNEESESNTAWTEAVLFKNGNELCCTEPSEEYLDEWILEYEGDEYVVVEEENLTDKNKEFIKKMEEQGKIAYGLVNKNMPITLNNLIDFCKEQHIDFDSPIFLECPDGYFPLAHYHNAETLGCLVITDNE